MLRWRLRLNIPTLNWIDIAPPRVDRYANWLIMPKYVVRYGAMRFLGIMQSRGDEKFARGSQVISRTDRGLECSVVHVRGHRRKHQGVEEPHAGTNFAGDDTGRFGRSIADSGPAARRVFEMPDLIASRRLPMELVDMEHVFGGERIVVYYLSENRVDFRDLVKQLAGEFQTRIEMRQIGVRDEAKLLADYGDCGKPVCCNTHLSEMPPVSMKMAKLQKATLDPTKISGRCGRLKCCLRYEYDTYEELQKDLPPVGSEILTQQGPAASAGAGDFGAAVVGRDGRSSAAVDSRRRRADGFETRNGGRGRQGAVRKVEVKRS